MAQAGAPEAPELLQRRLRWRCRRGTKELDVLLERYVELHWRGADAGQRAAFLRLLELPDPVLSDCLLDGAPLTALGGPADPALAAVVRCIRATPQALANVAAARGAAGSPAAAQASSLKGPC